MKTILANLVVLFSAVVTSLAAPKDDFAWTEVTATNMDVVTLSPLGKQVLADAQWKWKHAQTDHFVLHFEKDIFAAKVARMGEFFYSYIANDLKGAVDRAGGRSHIFVFRNEKDWKSFQALMGPGGTEWAFSLVQGPAMYLQQAGDIQSSAEVLGHEMTHLVVNRFFADRLPLWLNEGIAQWYGEFAYSEFKGVKKSKKAQFKDLKRPYAIPDLLAAEGYPPGGQMVRSFYDTGRYLVAFFMLEKPPEKFLPFISDLAGGMLPGQALQTHYDMASVQVLEEQFGKFIK